MMIEPTILTSGKERRWKTASSTVVTLGAIVLAASIPLFAEVTGWNPSHDATPDGKSAEVLAINGRSCEVFRHGVRPEWGYQAPQEDTFFVVHPKIERTAAPLYVVLHSAGHDVTIPGPNITVEPTTLTVVKKSN